LISIISYNDHNPLKLHRFAEIGEHLLLFL